jgi:hypothetical protein
MQRIPVSTWSVHQQCLHGLIATSSMCAGVGSNRCQVDQVQPSANQLLLSLVKSLLLLNIVGILSGRALQLGEQQGGLTRDGFHQWCRVVSLRGLKKYRYVAAGRERGSYLFLPMCCGSDLLDEFEVPTTSTMTAGIKSRGAGNHPQ